jgi:hypothetical protein
MRPPRNARRYREVAGAMAVLAAATVGLTGCQRSTVPADFVNRCKQQVELGADRQDYPPQTWHRIASGKTFGLSFPEKTAQLFVYVRSSATAPVTKFNVQLAGLPKTTSDGKKVAQVVLAGVNRCPPKNN